MLPYMGYTGMCRSAAAQGKLFESILFLRKRGIVYLTLIQEQSPFSPVLNAWLFLIRYKTTPYASLV